MKLFIDGEFIADLEPEQLSQQLNLSQQKLRKENRVIFQLECDGKKIDIHKLKELDFSLFKEINAITKPLSSVMQDALKEALSVLPDLIQDLRKICSDLRDNKIEEAVDIYSKLSPSFRLFILGLLSIKQNTVEEFNFDFQKLSLTLNEASLALKDANYIVFTDIIEYRIIPDLEYLLDYISQRVTKSNLDDFR